MKRREFNFILSAAVAGMLTACSTSGNEQPAAPKPQPAPQTAPAPAPTPAPAGGEKKDQPAGTDAKDKNSCGGPNGCGGKDDKKDKKEKNSCGGPNGCGGKDDKK